MDAYQLEQIYQLGQREYDFIAFDKEGNEVRFKTREEARAFALSLANASNKNITITKKICN